MNPNASLFPAEVRGFKKASMREMALLLLVAWLVPFTIHQVPWSGQAPLGAHLLPMFWAAFVAVYAYGLGVGMLVALFTPTVNLLLTGMPAARFLGVLGFELAVFSVCASLGLRRWPMFWIVAPASYLVAKIASTLVLSVTDVFGNIGQPVDFFVGSLRTGLAGLVVLALINRLLVKVSPKPDDWDTR